MVFYGFGLFWWFNLLVVLGLIFFWFFYRKISVEKKRLSLFYFFSFFVIGAWLSFFYGSWTIHDNPDPNQITMANSYIRYWLPIFVMTTPFAAFPLVWLQKIAYPWIRKISISFLLLLIFSLNSFLVFFHPQDGLISMRKNLFFYQMIQEDILARTQPESVMIVDRSDKIFFPWRRVRYPLRDEVTYKLMPQILEFVPLYYYGITFPQRDLDYLNEKKLFKQALRIEFLKTYGSESLYRIYRP
jgi:hypothetical protein